MPAPHKTLRARPVDRLTEERQVMRELPEQEPDVNRRWVTDALGPLRQSGRLVMLGSTKDDSGGRVRFRERNRELPASATPMPDPGALHICFRAAYSGATIRAALD